jgi:hypothetical protein
MVVAAGAALGSLAVYYSFLAPRRFSPSSVVLTMDLSTPPAEVNALSLLSLANVGRPNHYNTLRVLEHAAKDDKVRGLMAKVGGGAGWTMAQAQEIRQASQQQAARHGSCVYVISLADAIPRCLWCLLQSSASLSPGSSLTPSRTQWVQQTELSSEEEASCHCNRHAQCC